MADARIRVEANSATLPKTFIRSGKFEWIIDEPESFGGNHRTFTVETLLAQSHPVLLQQVIGSPEKWVLSSTTSG